MSNIVKYPDEVIPCRWTDKMKEARAKYRCVHGHSGLAHPNCYLRENGIEERKGCLDIEAGGLKADFDIVLSWAIKTVNKDEIVYDYITKEDLDSEKYDARLIATIVENMWNFTRIITHYGSNFRFDLPFVRARYLWLKARGLYDGPDFPGYGDMYVTDTYAMARKLLAISSRRQGSVGSVCQGEDIKTSIDRDYWMTIKYGTTRQRKAAIEYIVDHNTKDCIQLEGNYLAMLPFVRETRTSI